jgi:hypothetical protein
MLKFIDFVPRQIEPPGIFKQGQHQGFHEAVADANRWLADHDVQLLNVETVVLPNIWNRWEEGSADAALTTSGESPSRWHQVLRCWYLDPTPAAGGAPS